MSEQLINMLKRHEGVRSHVYLCSAGYETIAVGRNIAESGLGLSEDEIEFLLNNDIKRVREELEDTHGLFKHFVSRYRPNLDIDRVATGEHWYGSKAVLCKTTVLQCESLQSARTK